MIRAFIISLFMFFLISLNINISVAIAASSVSPDAKFNVDIDTAFNNRANALVVQSKAYYMEVVRRPESVLDLSCFSDSMSSFAQLGRQFSDVKFNFLALFKGNPLCSALTLSMDSSLEGDLQLFLKVPGLTIPSGEICSPDIDIAGKLTSKLSGLLGFSFPGGDLAEGKNLLGCPLKMDLKIGGDAAVAPMCVRATLPSMDCNAMTKLLYSSGNELLKELTGGAVDLTKGVNTGWAYLTVTDQGSIGAGVDVDMSDVLNAVSSTNPAFAAALKETREKIETIKKYHETYLKLMGGGSASVGISLGAGVSTNGSNDGLTSDGSFAVEAGHRFSAGTGQEFSFQLAEANPKIQNKLQKDILALQKGPGDPDGFDVWRPVINVDKTITLKDIFDAISDSSY